MSFVLALIVIVLFSPLSAFIYMQFAAWLHNNLVPGVVAMSYGDAYQFTLWTMLFAFMFGLGKGLAALLFPDSK